MSAPVTLVPVRLAKMDMSVLVESKVSPVISYARTTKTGGALVLAGAGVLAAVAGAFVATAVLAVCVCAVIEVCWFELGYRLPEIKICGTAARKTFTVTLSNL